MTKQEKLNLLADAYITKQVDDERKEIEIINDKLPKDIYDTLFEIQQKLDVNFELSYGIMSDACSIISEKELDYINGDDFDPWADADSQANVYTGVQLSYLTVNNEGEISDLMKDEAITSIAQACSIWHSQKVAEAIELLKEWINS